MVDGAHPILNPALTLTNFKKPVGLAATMQYDDWVFFENCKAIFKKPPQTLYKNNI